jgi:hypothetical protein
MADAWDDDDADTGGGGGGDDDDDDDLGEENDQDHHNDGEEEEEEEEEEDILDMEQEVQVQQDALLMRFCPHDSSMLYPQENKREKVLQYACRLCRYSEPAPDAPLVYRNERKKEVVRISLPFESSGCD